MSTTKNKIDFEDLLEEVGSFGRYQKQLVMFFLVPLGIAIPWFTMNILMMVYTPDHWCYVPEVATSNLSIDEQQKLIAPKNASSCFMYDANYTKVMQSKHFYVNPNTSLISCKSWQYDKTHFDETASSKWNLVCEKDYLTSLALTLNYAGSTIGTPIFGTFSDKFGRKPTFFILVFISTVTGIASVLVNDLNAFLILKTVNGSLMPSVYQLPYILLLEFVGPSKRARMNGIFNIAYTFGMCSLPLIAYLTRNWIIFGLITSSVTVFMLFYWRFLPESPRWLMSQGRYHEATVILTKVADANGKIHCAKELRKKIEMIGEMNKKEKFFEVRNTPIDLIRFPTLRKIFIIITLCWIADIFAYYGLLINLPNLGGNYFWNFFFSALVEAPGLLCCWYFMEKWGRRWSNVTALAITTCACLVVVIVPDTALVAQIFSLIGKFGASAAFFSIYQQSSELYPTTLRLIGMGMSGAIANIGNIVIPFIIYLAVIQKSIPFLVIGLVCLVAAISATCLPETLNEILPQTINDAEQFGKDQKFLSCYWKRTPSLSQKEDRAKTPDAAVGKVKENWHLNMSFIEE